jgi:hypothetical protein
MEIFISAGAIPFFSESHFTKALPIHEDISGVRLTFSSPLCDSHSPYI